MYLNNPRARFNEWAPNWFSSCINFTVPLANLYHNIITDFIHGAHQCDFYYSYDLVNITDLFLQKQEKRKLQCGIFVNIRKWRRKVCRNHGFVEKAEIWRSVKKYKRPASTINVSITHSKIKWQSRKYTPFWIIYERNWQLKKIFLKVHMFLS